ncbi:MAG: hypothetical protein OXU61_12540 [Gammaproteobacteria bacterium]|nr:hypothetical protein [Gammaproteobacteria bacterium]
MPARKVSVIVVRLAVTAVKSDVYVAPAVPVQSFSDSSVGSAPEAGPTVYSTPDTASAPSVIVTDVVAAVYDAVSTVISSGMSSASSIPVSPSGTVTRKFDAASTGSLSSASLNVTSIVRVPVNSAVAVGAIPSPATSAQAPPAGSGVVDTPRPPDGGTVYVTLGVEVSEARAASSVSVSASPAASVAIAPALPAAAWTAETVRDPSLSTTANSVAATAPAV